MAGEPVPALLERAPEVFGGIVFVMQMDLRFAARVGAYFGDALHDIGVVLLDRVKESVLWWRAVGIAKFAGQGRPRHAATSPRGPGLPVFPRHGMARSDRRPRA